MTAEGADHGPSSRSAALRRWVLLAAVVLAANTCTSASRIRAQTPPDPAPPTIPDAQPAVDAPLFVGQNTFPAPLGRQADLTPPLATVRSNGGNTGVFDGPAPLGKAPVTDSTANDVRAPLLWNRQGDMVTGCRQQVAADLIKGCVATVSSATLAIQARWLPPGQDLNLGSLALDDQRRAIFTTAQSHLVDLGLPDDGGTTFRPLRDMDVTAYLAPSELLAYAIEDGADNLWFATGARLGNGDPAPATTVGYVTPDDKVVVTRLPGLVVESPLAVDQGDVYLTTAPATGADVAGATSGIYDLTAGGGQVQTVWRATYDVGSARQPGAPTRGRGSPVVLLGPQYLAITDNADAQAHLLVYLRGPLGPQARPGSDPRLVCKVGLFTPGESAVSAGLIGLSSGPVNSVIVANGWNAPGPVAVAGADDPANSMNAMGPGLTRVDVAADGSGCTVSWTTPIRMKTAPVLSSATGLIYGYSQDEQRAATGSYIWYFVAIDYRTGRVVWRQRAGAGGTKNDNREPLVLGANGVLYQSVPLGLVWMRDLAQRP